jgi:Zn-dependent protease with chaperone function
VSQALGTLALALLATLGFALATSLALALMWPLAARAIRRGHPARRAQWLFGIAAAPVLLPLGLLALCLLPGVVSALGLHADHCLDHAEHAHLCFAHPALALTAPLAWLLSGAALGLLAAIGLGAARLARAQRRLEPLRSAGRAALAADTHLVASTRPFSLALGLWRPQVLVSTALAERLAPQQLDVVLEHERAHARRRDSLRRLVAGVLSLPHWPRLRRALRDELGLACEQACDEAAAQRCGDRLRVAETLLAVERFASQLPQPAHPGLASIAGSALDARVRSLLEPEPAQPARIVWRAALLALPVAWLLVDPLHHATEHLLSLLLRAL